MADAAQVAPLTERLSSVEGVVGASQDRRMQATADPASWEQYGPVSIRASVLPTTADEARRDGRRHRQRGRRLAPRPVPDVAQRPATRAVRDQLPQAPETGDPDLTGQPGNVDPYGHGTHVAGIITAARDNGLGGAGVAPGVQILPVRVLDTDGGGWESDITAGILWAHQQGADIINLSLSGTGPEPKPMTAAINTVTSTPAASPPRSPPPPATTA